MVSAAGGAVAYVGNAQMSSTHGSERFEERFWCALATIARPGISANLRAPSAGAASLWEHHLKAYYGCPEMPAWLAPPKRQLLDCPASAKQGAKLALSVRSPEGAPLAGHRVTAMAGWDGTRAAHVQSKLTGPDGVATFATPRASAGPLRITTSAPGFVPVSQDVDLT
jgi:hypothetical protein